MFINRKVLIPNLFWYVVDSKPTIWCGPTLWSRNNKGLRNKEGKRSRCLYENTTISFFWCFIYLKMHDWLVASRIIHAKWFQTRYTFNLILHCEFLQGMRVFKATLSDWLRMILLLLRCAIFSSNHALIIIDKLFFDGMWLVDAKVMFYYFLHDNILSWLQCHHHVLVQVSCHDSNIPKIIIICWVIMCKHKVEHEIIFLVYMN